MGLNVTLHNDDFVIIEGGHIVLMEDIFTNPTEIDVAVLTYGDDVEKWTLRVGEKIKVKAVDVFFHSSMRHAGGRLPSKLSAKLVFTAPRNVMIQRVHTKNTDEVIAKTISKFSNTNVIIESIEKLMEYQDEE